MPREKAFTCHTCGTKYTTGRCPECNKKRRRGRGGGGFGGGRRGAAARISSVLASDVLPVNPAACAVAQTPAPPYVHKSDDVAHRQSTMTDKKQSEEIKVFATGLQPSSALQGLFAELSPSQVAGIIRIVEAELAGRSIESLFHGADKICNRSTYYRAKGWSSKPAFVEALAMARKEIRSQRLQSAVDDAIEELKLATPAAARDLRRQVTGDERAIVALVECVQNSSIEVEIRQVAINNMGAIGTPRATEVLIDLLKTVDLLPLKISILNALGRAGAGLDTQRRMADVAVLDRADRKTADKGADSDLDLDEIGKRRWAQIAPLLNQMQEEAIDSATSAAVVAPTPVPN